MAVLGSPPRYEALASDPAPAPSAPPRPALGRRGVASIVLCVACVGAVACFAYASASQNTAAGPAAQSLLRGDVSGLVVPAPKKYTIFHTTDIHGWINGHRHIPDLDADFGDFAALMEHMKAKAASEGTAFMAVDSGDLIEGTGLSDATPIHGEDILPIVDQLGEYDLLTIGNHELYESNDQMLQQFEGKYIPMWNANKQAPKFLTNNIFYKDSSNRLAAGFSSTVSSVGDKIGMVGMSIIDGSGNIRLTMEDVVTSMKHPDFVQFLNSQKDCKIMMASIHMDADSAEVKAMYEGLKAAISNTVPIILFTGHYHMKKFVVFDKVDDSNVRSFAMESGKYFQVIGLLEFELDTDAGLLRSFSQKFMETSVKNFYEVSGTTSENFMTPKGLVLKSELKKFTDALGLNKVKGCSNMTYSTYGNITDDNSAYNLLFSKVYPGVIYDSARPNTPFAISNRFTIRDNLYEGQVQVDDILSFLPFPNKIYVVGGLSGSQLIELVNDLDKPTPPDTESHFMHEPLSTIDENKTYDVVALAYDYDNGVKSTANKLFPDSKFEEGPYSAKCSNIQECMMEFVPKYMPCPALVQP